MAVFTVVVSASAKSTQPMLQEWSAVDQKDKNELATLPPLSSSGSHCGRKLNGYGDPG